MCAMYGEGAVTDRSCQRWFMKFCAEISHWTMLRSHIDQLKLIAVETLTENNLRSPTWEIADIRKMSSKVIAENEKCDF